MTITRLQDWAEEALKVSFGSAAMQRKLESCNIAEMAAEAKKLALHLQDTNKHISGQGFDVVFSHNDVQENNMLQTQYGLRLIDFEYSGFNFQAFDIANFFCEHVMDYTHPKYPFYSANHANYPCQDEQRLFAAVYLSEYLETTVYPSDEHMVQPLLEVVNQFTQVSHMLWGLWSIIRSPQAPTYEDFDFIDYGKFRFDIYRRNQYKPEIKAQVVKPRKRDMVASSTIGAAIGGLLAGLLVVRLTRN